ncbi:hypothetical protein HYS31_04070 [Candidatus Woesearchaeota archaeon]|nr:hypothetical protein [Candidatus Woesearchaeota archaeon]
MKRLTFFFLILLLFPAAAFAEILVFSGAVITGRDYEIDKKTFSFGYDESSSKVYVQNPYSNMIVPTGECRSNDIFKVCAANASYYDKNITTWVFFYKIDISVYKLTGSLETDTAISQATLLQNEPVDFSITIRNPTSFDVTGISYTEDLSPFTVIESTGCSLDGTIMSWQGSLKPNFEKKCSAKLYSGAGGSFILSGNLSYFNSYENEKISVDTASVSVLPEQLKVSRLVDSNVEVQQPFYMNMSLQNLHPSEKMRVVIAIEPPENFAILKKPYEMLLDKNSIKHIISLEHGSSYAYSLYLIGKSESKASIKQSFDYEIKGIRSILENYTFVQAAEPNPIINFTSDPPQPAIGQSFNAYARLTNPSSIYSLKGIKAKINAPSNSLIEKSFSKLGPKEDFLVSAPLSIPDDFDKASFEIDVDVEYGFEDHTRSLSESYELKINSSKEPISPIQPVAEPAAASQITNGANNSVQLGSQASTSSELQTNNAAEMQSEIPENGYSNLWKTALLGILTFGIIVASVVAVFRIRKKKKSIIPQEISSTQTKPK